MKKILVIAAVAIAFASAGYSATLNWSVSAVQNDKDGKALSGAMVALVAATSGSGASGITFSSTPDGKWTLTGAQVIDVATLGTSGKFDAARKITVGSEGWGVGTYQGKDFDGDDTSVVSTGTGTANKTMYYMIVFDSSSYTSGNYAVLSAAAATQVASATATVGATAFTSSTGASSSWQAVPEPCTAALLALGLAAFGLRRKVA